MHTRIDYSTWDYQLFPNPHALVIYLKFVPIREAALKRFKECLCENDDVHLHCQIWILSDGHYC